MENTVHTIADNHLIRSGSPACSIRYHAFGAPEDVLRVDREPAPLRRELDEVPIRELMRPINPGDLLGIAGRYRSPGVVGSCLRRSAN